MQAGCCDDACKGADRCMQQRVVMPRASARAASRALSSDWQPGYQLQLQAQLTAHDRSVGAAKAQPTLSCSLSWR